MLTVRGTVSSLCMRQNREPGFLWRCLGRDLCIYWGSSHAHCFWAHFQTESGVNATSQARTGFKNLLCSPCALRAMSKNGRVRLWLIVSVQIPEITVSCCSLPPLSGVITSVSLPMADTSGGLDQLAHWYNRCEGKKSKSNWKHPRELDVLFIFNGTTLTPLLHFGVKTNLLLLCLTEFLVKETLSYSVHLQVLVD